MASALDGDFRISAKRQKIAKHRAPFPLRRDPEATLIFNSDDKIIGGGSTILIIIF